MKPSLAERLYALSLYLYPPSFRREFGEAMKQAFGDRLRERDRMSSRLFLDMTRDTVFAAAREHVQAPDALLRMFALLMLMFAATAIFVRGESLRTALIDGVVSYQESTRRAAFDAYERGVRDYNASIADRYAARDDARSQLIAAQFYGGDFDFLDIRFPSDAAAEPAIAAHRTQLAAAAIEKALRNGWDDPVVLWNAAVMCPVSSAVCHSHDVLARLESLAPENGAVWWLEFVAAARAKDAGKMRAAIAKVAKSRDFTVYENAMSALWIGAYASLTPPSQLSSVAPEMASSPDEAVASGLHGRLRYLEWTIAEGTYAFERTCESPAAASREDCRHAADLLATSDIFAARLAGLRTLAHLDPAAASAYRSACTEAMWDRTTWWKLLFRADRNDPPLTARDAQRWMVALRQHGTVFAAAEALTAASATPHAPPGWNDGWTVQ